MRTRPRLAAVAACAAALAFAAGPALAEPALWVARTGTSTVYLFGTMHLLDPKLAWRTPALDRAFHEAGELWLEIPLPVAGKGSAMAFTPEETKRIGEIVTTLGFTKDGPTLSSKLTPAENAQLVSLLAPIPQARIDRFRPWLAALTATSKLAMQLGLASSAGPDVVLDEEAMADGKAVHAFETTEQQYHFFADLSPEEELDFLRGALADAGAGKALLQTMEKAWASGDDKAVAELVDGRMREKSPLFYRRFVVERNNRWLPEIETMLKTPGVRFIAVGEGHLVGSDGVVALLKKDGFGVERVR